jgi:hypothetical protein
LARLEDESSIGRSHQEEAVRRTIETEMAGHTLVFQEWTRRFDETGERIIAGVAAGMEKLCSEQHERETAFARTRAEQETARYREMCRRLEELQAAAERKLSESFESVLEKAAAVQQTWLVQAKELFQAQESLGAMALDSAKHQQGMLAAGSDFFSQTMQRQEETAAKIQVEAEGAYRAVLERLEGFLAASARGVEAITGQLDRAAAGHESQMREISQRVAAGVEHTIDKGRHAFDELSDGMGTLQRHGDRLAAAVGDLNRSLAQCAPLLGQVRTGVAWYAAARRRRRGGSYGRRIARLFGWKEGGQS